MNYKPLTAEEARKKYREASKKRNEALLADILDDIEVSCVHGKDSRLVLDYLLDDDIIKILREDLGYTVRVMDSQLESSVATVISW